MEQLSKLVKYLDKYLALDEIEDDSWNGLQFEGNNEVQKVIVAVDAGLRTFKQTVARKGDLLIVHHGHFWKTASPTIDGWKKERINILFQNNVSLYAAHLPLDRHKEVGNNAQLLKTIGATVTTPFYGENGTNISWLGELKNGKSLIKIVSELNKKIGAKSRVIDSGREIIRKIAVCSGGGGYRGFWSAAQAGVDLFITGDSVDVYQMAKDVGISVICAGHYATETVGIKALAKRLESQFKVETEFIDIPTGF